MDRGQIVMVRAYGDEALRRVVWEVGAKAVMICNPDLYEKARRDTSIHPIGFPKEAVFEFDPALFRQLREAYQAGRADDLVRLWSTARSLQ